MQNEAPDLLTAKISVQEEEKMCCNQMALSARCMFMTFFFNSSVKIGFNMKENLKF